MARAREGSGAPGGPERVALLMAASSVEVEVSGAGRGGKEKKNMRTTMSP